MSAEHTSFSPPLLITRIYELGIDLFVYVVGDYDCDVFVIMKHPWLNIHHPTLSFLQMLYWPQKTVLAFHLFRHSKICYKQCGMLENVMKTWMSAGLKLETHFSLSLSSYVRKAGNKTKGCIEPLYISEMNKDSVSWRTLLIWYFFINSLWIIAFCRRII